MLILWQPKQAQVSPLASEIPSTANLWQLITTLSPCISLSQVRSSRRRTAVRLERLRCVWGSVVQDFVVHAFNIKGGFFAFPRPAIVQALVNKLGKNCHTHYSKRVSSYSAPSSSSSPFTLQFADGSGAHCDVLIGADGVKSSIRRCMFEHLACGVDAEAQIGDGPPQPHLIDPSKEAATVGNSPHPVWSGTLAYRAMFPAGDLATKVPSHRVLSTPMCVRDLPSLLSVSSYSYFTAGTL